MTNITKQLERYISDLDEDEQELFVDWLGVNAFMTDDEETCIVNRGQLEGVINGSYVSYAFLFDTVVALFTDDIHGVILKANEYIAENQ